MFQKSFADRNRRAAGGIEGLVGLLKSRTNAVNQQAAGALRNLALGSPPENRQLSKAADGIEGLVGLLQAGTNAAKERAAGTLRTLAGNDGPETQRCIGGAAGGIEGLVALLTSGTDAAKLKAARALRNLSWKNSENQQHIREAGGIQALLAVLDSSCSEELKATAASILGNMAWDSNIAKDISRTNAVHLIMRLQWSESGVVAALGSLCIIPANQRVILQAGQMDLLIQALVSLLGDPTDTCTVEQSAYALSFLTEHFSQRILEFSAAQPLVRLLGSSEGETAAYAAAVLAGLAWRSPSSLDKIRPLAVHHLEKLLKDGTMLAKENAHRALQALGPMCKPLPPPDTPSAVMPYTINHALSNDLLRALAPDAMNAGIAICAFGQISRLDPLKIAPVLHNALNTIYEACNAAIVFRVEVLKLQERLGTLRPFLNKLSEVIRAVPENDLVQHLLPCSIRIHTVLEAAKKLLDQLPSQKSRVLRRVQTLCTAGEFSKQYKQINHWLSEALGDTNTCISILHLSKDLCVDKGPWTLQDAADHQCDTQQMGHQILKAFNGNTQALKDQLQQEGLTLEDFMKELTAAGANMQPLLESMRDDIAAVSDQVLCVDRKMDDMQKQLEDMGCQFERLLQGVGGMNPSEMPDLGIDIRHVKVYKDKILGAGGFGKVYRGSHMGRAVAVKVLDRVDAKDEHERRSIYKEAYIMSKLRWGGIVHFSGLIVDPARGEFHLAMVMELISGQPLSLVVRDTSKTMVQRVRWCLRAACALVVLHEFPKPYGPIVHGDLKPSNFLVCTQDNELKLLDFGCSVISKTTQGLLTSGNSPTASSHTAPYSAPEIWEKIKRSMKVVRTTQTDIYALAMVMYEVCTGEMPFEDLNYQYGDIRVAVLERSERPHIAELREKLPNMAQLIQDCWAQQPEKRPDAATVYNRLEGILNTLEQSRFESLLLLL